MLFSSMVFLWIFLPIVILGNFLLGFIPGKNTIKIKNIFLLLASLIFYAWGGTYYLMIMISVILINYFGALLLDKIKKHKKIILAISIIANLGILFYFKYFNMFLENKTIVLPIGISFFIFQSMSYLIDVYRKDAEVQKNLFNLALYVSFFPQLIAGPIVKYKEVDEAIVSRKENLELFSEGVRRFIYGLGKKVLISNQLALVVDKIWGNGVQGAGFTTVLVASLIYAFQIYYDFSGYSDMAIGLGKMFGFRFNENFNYPYLSSSVTEFWRRWHISLGTWFREYVYIPLGGSRTGHTYRNLFIVFFLTGIWHGADLSFFLWGAIFGIIIVLEKAFLLKTVVKPQFKVFNVIATFIIVIILWIPFRADNITDAVNYIKEFGNFTNLDTVKYYFNNRLVITFILGLFLSGPHYLLCNRVYNKIKTTVPVVLLEGLLLAGIFTYCIFELASGTYNPFIYFQF